LPKTNRSRRTRDLQREIGCTYTQALALVAGADSRGETGPLIEAPGGEIEVIPRASAVPDARRDVLLDRINAVIATNWRSTRSRWWSREHSPFRDDFGLAFFHAAGEIVAYFIFQKLTLDGMPVFYGAGTAVDVAHQGKRYYQLMQAHALTAAWRSLEPVPDEVYVAWRTRNPHVWISNSRFCKRIAPSLWTEIDFVELRRRRYPSGSMSARLAAMLADPADALFSLGVVDRSTFEAISAALESHLAPRLRSPRG
jgi:hypothetical protein